MSSASSQEQAVPEELTYARRWAEQWLLSRDGFQDIKGRVAARRATHDGGQAQVDLERLLTDRKALVAVLLTLAARYRADAGEADFERLLLKSAIEQAAGTYIPKAGV